MISGLILYDDYVSYRGVWGLLSSTLRLCMYSFVHLPHMASLHQKRSIEAFCLRMLRRKYFDMSETLICTCFAYSQISKWWKNSLGFNKFFGNGSSLCNLCKRVGKSTKWFCGVLRKVPTKSISEGQGINKRF